MADFSATDASLVGFRIVAERPWAVAVWSVLQFVVSIGLTALVAATAGPAVSRARELSLQPPSADPSAMLALMSQIAPAYGAVLAVSLALYAVLFAGMNRAVLRPQERGFGYLRLGRQELRQFGLFIVLFAIVVGIYLALAIVATILGVVVVTVAGPAAAFSAILSVFVVTFFPALVFVWVRLSLASPLAFDRGRIDLAAAWKMSRGRFWPMFGSYLIAFVLSIVVLVLTLAIAVAVVAVVGGGLGALGAVMQEDFSSPATVLSPARLAYAAVTSVGQALTWPITLAPPAAIYRALGGPAEATTARVFS